MFKSGRGVGKFRCPLFRSIRLNTLRAVMNPCSLFFGSRWFRHRCSMHPAADMCQAFWDSFYSSRQRTGSVVCAAVSWVVTQEVGIRRRRRPTFESMPSLMVMFSIVFHVGAQVTETMEGGWQCEKCNQTHEKCRRR